MVSYSEDTLQGHSDDHNFDENCSHVMACAVITSPSVHWNLSVEQLPWHDRRPGETGHLSPKTKLAWNSLSRFEDSTRGSVDTKPNFEDTEGDHQDTDSAFDECDSPLEVGDPCSEDSESISQDPNTKSLDLDSVPLKMKICEIFQSCPGGGILNSVDYICLFPRERPDCHSKDGTTRNKHNNRLHRVVTSEKRHPWTFEQGAVYQHVNGHINECIVKGVTFAQPPFPELSTKRRNEGNDRWPQQEKVASGSLRRQEGNAKSSQEKLGNGKSSQDKVGSGKSSQEKLGSGKSSQDKVGSGKSSQEKLGSGKSSQDKVGSGKSSQEKLGSGKSSQERLAGRSWLSSSTVRAVLLIILTTGNCWSVGAAKNQLRGLRCPPCRQIHCAIRDPKELDCPGGVSTGVCGCCPVCARLAGQSCGGDWSYLGKCDRGLTCRTPAQPTAPVYPTQKEPAGVCVKELTRSHDQADAAFEQKCRPLCTLQLCTRRPRAVCSAREVAETERPCQGTCQHTSCRACAMEEDTECVKCTGRDFRCLKQFGRCVARKRCRGKGGRRSCRKSRFKVGPGRRFVCKVPDCPN